MSEPPDMANDADDYELVTYRCDVCHTTFSAASYPIIVQLARVYDNHGNSCVGEEGNLGVFTLKNITVYDRRTRIDPASIRSYSSRA